MPRHPSRRDHRQRPADRLPHRPHARHRRIRPVPGRRRPPSYWDIHDKPHGHGYFEATQPGEVLYNDVAPHLAQQSIASLGRQSLTSVTQPLTQAAWHTVPSTYILCEQDMAIPLPLQESMATRAQRTVLLHSGHSPFLSQPAELARILRQELTLQPRN